MFEMFRQHILAYRQSSFCHLNFHLSFFDPFSPSNIFFFTFCDTNSFKVTLNQDRTVVLRLRVAATESRSCIVPTRPLRQPNTSHFSHHIFKVRINEQSHESEACIVTESKTQSHTCMLFIYLFIVQTYSLQAWVFVELEV